MGWAQTVERCFRREVLAWFGAERAVGTITADEVIEFRAAMTRRPDGRTKCPRCHVKWRLDSSRRWCCGKCGSPAPEGATINPATVNRLLWALAAFGGWAVAKNYAAENAWADHESFAEDDEGTPDLTEAEFETLLDALDRRPSARFPWRQLFEFADETGLRKSELGRLARKDINRADRTASVVSSARRGRTKAQAGRTVVLSPRALVLDELPLRTDGLVFGKIPDPRRTFAAAAKATGLERVWLHLMRHTAAHRVGRAGATVSDLMRFGGWATQKMAAPLHQGRDVPPA